MKIMTLGNGFVAEHLPYEKNTYKIGLDLQDVWDCLSRCKGGILINCLGKTGRPNIDWCENNKEETYNSNVILPLMIADWCKQNDTHLIHLGSGCIYYGQSPNIYRHQTKKSVDPRIEVEDNNWITVDHGWREIDHANPQSFYSKSKYAADLMLGQMPHCTILRLRM